MKKYTIEDLDSYFDTQILQFENRRLLIRIIIWSGKIIYIVKTSKGEYHVNKLKKALKIFNDLND